MQSNKSIKSIARQPQSATAMDAQSAQGEPGDSPSQTRLTLTVKTALDILRTFTPENPARGVNEIASLLGLHKSTISRLLATLEDERLVRRDPLSEKYQLSLGLLELAGVLLNQLDLRPTALPFLRPLANVTKEAVSLAVWDGTSTMLIEHLPSPHPIGYLGRIGHRTPAYCSSGGKAMLAFAEESKISAVIENGFEQFTARTITSGQALLHELEEIRRRGYSINHGEYWDGVAGVGAPVWDISRSPIAAISIVGPAYRFSSERIEEFGNMARDTASQLSRQLGSPDPR